MAEPKRKRDDDLTSTLIGADAVSPADAPTKSEFAAAPAMTGRQAPEWRPYSPTFSPGPLSSRISPAPGDRFGENDRFEIVERLGVGGMGHVFRAVDWHLDRAVAVKFILQNREMPLAQLVAMLKREAKTTAKLNHENIVSIFDMDAYNGVPFLVMELLAGQSLDAMMKSSRLSPLRATRIMAQVARGLLHAHTNGIIHRDLKPSNVFLLRDGRAKILDFGISRFERPVATPGALSEAGPTACGLGTPTYMAPEQWRAGPQDARTDIWAAGVMFYQMLTGRLPYGQQELLRFKVHARVRSVAPSVRLLDPDLPEEADRIVATALNEDAEGRFQTAQELWDALRELERVLAGGAADSDASSGLARVERRPLTLLWCSLLGLEALELDDVIEADLRFYQICAEAVKRWDGCIGTPVGGRFFCCFGYPSAQETDAQRAVRTALQIAQALREGGGERAPGLAFKIGVHSGVVGLPNLPGAGQGAPAMQGDAPNVAVRLAERAAPGVVVVSQATLDLTGGLFLTEPEVGAEGAHRVLGELVPESRFEQAFAAELTPFVGRDAEIGDLYRLWDEAKAGRGRVVVVSGEPGIGKSRLVQTLKERVIDEHNVRLTCQCWPHFKNSALHPIIELLVRSMGVQREDTPEQKLEKLCANLAPLGFELPEAVPLFASLLSIPFEGSYAPLGLAPEAHKVRTLKALASMLLRRAAGRPTLFIVEDMHWVDHSTVEFLNELVDQVPEARLLVVLTCRPEFRPPWSSRAHLRLLPLDRLSSASTAAMIDRASRRRRLPPEVVRRLIATADGVPLFIEELTRMFTDAWPGDEGGQAALPRAIPGTLHELLLARLDRLRGVGKQVAQLGAILGREFSYALVQRISPLDEMSLQEGLETLIGAGVLLHRGKPPDSIYVFKHALIQHSAYQSLVKAERQRHHRRAAEVLQVVSLETAEQQPELLAYHHAEAGNLRQAVAFWEKAGQRAIQRSALVEAIDHYARAREALKGLPEGPGRDRRELGLLLAVGSPLMSVHGYASPEVERTYARARELAHAAGGQADLFPAMQGLWQFYYVRGLLPTARDLGLQLLELARDSGDSTSLLMAHRSVASTAFLQGDFETTRDHTRAGFGLYDEREHGTLALRAGHDPGVAHGVYLAWALWMLGLPDQSLEQVLPMIDLAKRLAHPLTIAYALCFAALMRNHRGEHGAARALSDEALAITTEHKFALWTAWAQMQRGWALAGAGDHARGIPQMREGLDGWMNTGARVGTTFFPVTLAEMCLHAGQLEQTAALLEEATPMVERNDEHFYEPELCRLKGELALRQRGRSAEGRDEAEAHFGRGLEVARAQRARSWELRLAMSRGRLLAARGEQRRARDELRAVYEAFTEGHATADLKAARAQIEASKEAGSNDH
jgi:TOMM system kinase/cyclase fusion protein